jgi:hypothetical protein
MSVMDLPVAIARQGDAAKAHAAYQDFLTLWKGADPDIPILQQPRRSMCRGRYSGPGALRRARAVCCFQDKGT